MEGPARGQGTALRHRLSPAALARRQARQNGELAAGRIEERSQVEEVTEMQLHIYVVGHEELTGRTADFVEIYELVKSDADGRCCWLPAPARQATGRVAPAHGLERFVEETGVDELIVASAIYEHSARLHSYEILATQPIGVTDGCK